MQLLPATLLDRFIALFPEPQRGEVLAGLQQLDMPALKVGAEAVEAERAHVPFADAARDHVHFPALARFHHGLRDLLQFVFPPEVAAQMRLVVRSVAGGAVGPVRRELFIAASRATGPLGGLLRFILTEALWLNVLLATWADDGTLEASECLHEAGREAQRILAEAVADPVFAEEGVRPLELMVAGLLHRVDAKLTEIGPLVAKTTSEFKARFDLLAEASVRARAMEAHHAAVVRAISDAIRDQKPVGSQQIVDRHPDLFQTTDAVDQRRRRLKPRGLEDAARQPSRNRFIDILLEEFASEESA